MHRKTEKQINVPETGKNAKEEEENSTYELKILNLNFVLLNYVGLWISNTSSQRAKLLYNCFTAFLLLVMATTIIAQVVALVTFWGNMKVITYTLASLMGVVITTCDYVNFLYHKRLVFEIVEDMRTEFIAKMKPMYRKFLDTAESRAKIFTVFRCLLAVVVISAAGLLPVINKDNTSDADVEFRNITIEKILTEKLVLVMYTPVDVRKSPQYEITFVIQLFAASMMVIASQAIDLLLMVLMSLVAAQFKILCILLDEMVENVSVKELCDEKYRSLEDFKAVSSLDGIPESGKEDAFRLYLVDCITQHQAAIQFAYKLNNVVRVSGLLQMINIPIMMCATGYHVTQGGVNVNDYFKFLTLLLIIMYKLFVFCWYGQDVIDQSEAVQIAVYGTEWYRMGPAFRSLVPMMLMRSNKPVKLRNGIFNDLCFETFSAVLNTAYSYIALLRQFSES